MTSADQLIEELPTYSIAYNSNPYDPSVKSEFLCHGTDGKVYYNPASIPKWPQVLVLTWEASSFVNALGLLNIELPEYILDISEAVLLLSGKSYRGEGNKKNTLFWNSIKSLTRDKDTINEMKAWSYQIDKTFTRSQEKINPEAGLKLSQLILKLWSKIKHELIQKQEYHRFISIELPIIKILSSIQTKGLRIDSTSLKNILNRLKLESVERSRKLRLDHNLNPLDDNDVKIWLKSNGFEVIVGYEKRSIDLTDILEIISSRNKVAKIIKEERRVAREITSLLQLGVLGKDRVHPRFISMGTVTGRILFAEPHLQFIRKSSRTILSPDQNMEFLYPDYSQFEPSILADESKDPALLDDVNSGDLYKNFSRQVLKDTSLRGSAKIMFNAYCNGMSKTRLSKLAAEATGMPENEAKQIVNSFLGRYQTLESWKKENEKILLHENKIGSRFGNYRYRTSKSNKLTSVEKRWALNQRIQGTASLILKRVMLQISSNLQEVDILLPMHDALLCQIPKESNKIKERVKNIFEAELNKECNSITPKVQFEFFS